MSKYVERVENLIRVVKSIRDDKFDLRHWYNPATHCGCAIGHALQDDYFIAQKFKPSLVDWGDIAAFFDISMSRLRSIIVMQIGNETRLEVLAKLRVLLMEKMAQEIDFDVHAAIDMQMEMEHVL